MKRTAARAGRGPQNASRPKPVKYALLTLYIDRLNRVDKMAPVKYTAKAKWKESSMNGGALRSRGKATGRDMQLAEVVQIADLEIFERIVSAGSMSAAARELGLAPASISNRIGRLEKRLSMKLLHRTTRELWLTPFGQGFYERAVQVLGAAREAKAFVAFAHDGTADVEADPEGWYPPSLQPLGRWVLGSFKTRSGHSQLAPAFCTAMGRWVRAGNAEGCPTVLAQTPQRWRSFAAGTGQECVEEAA